MKRSWPDVKRVSATDLLLMSEVVVFVVQTRIMRAAWRYRVRLEQGIMYGLEFACLCRSCAMVDPCMRFPQLDDLFTGPDCFSRPTISTTPSASAGSSGIEEAVHQHRSHTLEGGVVLPALPDEVTRIAWFARRLSKVAKLLPICIKKGNSVHPEDFGGMVPLLYYPLALDPDHHRPDGSPKKGDSLINGRTVTTSLQSMTRLKPSHYSPSGYHAEASQNRETYAGSRLSVTTATSSSTISVSELHQTATRGSCPARMIQVRPVA
ncbi:unnamed protein product [Taenia asiatica]|uniref:Uncharacterized protein n=1 Tax=Taenia asiatica TaxID=60517 RepID=A0A158R7T2_TAEAS|nr:unnamed protein product [Taenia asiatica]